MEKNNNEWKNWTSVVRKYAKPNAFKSWWQIINSFVPYILLWGLMVYSLDYSYWITLLLSIFAAGFLVRIFIIFHDCGHGSFFKSKRLSTIVGIISGGLVFTAYHKWHHQHKVHHQTVGNLDKRGMGDVLTWTVNEYKNSSKGKQLFYRIYRNPIVILLLAPIFLFLVFSRLPDKRLSKKINLYSHLTTLGLLAAILLMSLLIGFKAFVMIQIPIMYFATVFGVWLFYVQHQFEDVIWERNDNWDYKTIALNGSSYLKFPKVLQWFSGNIGFHHIHHLSLKIPNYNLEQCHSENSIFQKKALTFWDGIKSIKYRLWDEEKHRLVSFKEVRG